LFNKYGKVLYVSGEESKEQIKIGEIGLNALSKELYIVTLLYQREMKRKLIIVILI